MEELQPITPPKRKKTLKYVAIAIGVIIAATIIAAIVSQTCFTTYIVEGQSMNPTLDGGTSDPYDGEKLILNIVATPKVGDIVVFKPSTWSSYKDKALVKRVIAVGGDTIYIKSNKVYVNDAVIDEPYIMPNSIMEDMAKISLKEDEFFCMGDNINNSHDCRFESPITKDMIIGRCWLIKSPNNKLRKP